MRLYEWERCWIQQHTKILLLLRYAGQMYECVRLLVNRFDDISSTDLNGGGLVARCRLSFYCKQKNNRTTWFVMLSGSFEWPFVDLSLNWVYRTVSLFQHTIFAMWIGKCIWKSLPLSLNGSIDVEIDSYSIEKTLWIHQGSAKYLIHLVNWSLPEVLDAF